MAPAPHIAPRTDPDVAPGADAPRRAGPLRVRLAAVAADPGRVRKLVETACFALAAPLVGALAAPADPLGLDAGFAWAIVPPTVLAARYGSVWGVACALLTGLACLAQAGAYAERPFALVALVVGTLVATLAVGEIALAWRRRSARAEAENAYLRARLEEFSNDYHVLKVSHGLLRDSLAGRRMSLREALQRLERAVPEARSGTGDGASFGPGFAGNAELMAVFAHFCSVQVAGLYAMRGPGVVAPEPVAEHGSMGALPSFDPLLRAAIAEGKAVAARPDAPAAEADERALLAVVPIVDSGGLLHGVLAVREMHFMAFRRENLNLMALLGAWLGDRFGRAGGFAASPEDHFAAELDAALQRVREFEVPATLVRVRTGAHPRAADVAAFVARDIRSLDRARVVADADGVPVVALLLPLSAEGDARDYARRMRCAVRERFGVDPGELVGEVRVRELDADDARADCLAFVTGRDGAADGAADGVAADGAAADGAADDGDDRLRSAA